MAQNDVIYHLSWAVFKHLPDRVPYKVVDLDLRHFCVFRHKTCFRIECLVALSIVTGYFPSEIAESLLKCYEPVDELVRRRLTAHTSPSNLFVILYEERILDLKTVLSTIAENHYQKGAFPDVLSPTNSYLKAMFRANGKDVEFDLSKRPPSELRNFRGPSDAEFPDGFVEKINMKIDPFYRSVNEEDGYEAKIRQENRQLGVIQLVEKLVEWLFCFWLIYEFSF